jgi:hypothetical protein
MSSLATVRLLRFSQITISSSHSLSLFISVLAHFTIMRYLTPSLLLISLSLVHCDGPPNPSGYDPPNPALGNGPDLGTPLSGGNLGGPADAAGPPDVGGPPSASTPIPRACPAVRLQGSKDNPLLVGDPACPTGKQSTMKSD